jgi:hypothetical protein
VKILRYPLHLGEKIFVVYEDGTWSEDWILTKILWSPFRSKRRFIARLGSNELLMKHIDQGIVNTIDTLFPERINRRPTLIPCLKFLINQDIDRMSESWRYFLTGEKK